MAKAKSTRAVKAKARSPIEEFIALPDAEKERIAAQFDKEFVATRRLSPEQRKLWRKAKRRVGRPTIGEGSKAISITVEKGLLKQADALARRRKITRAELVAAALVAELAKAG